MNNWYLASGDFGFFWPAQIRSLSWLPQVYQTDIGFGWSQLMVMWLAYPYTVLLKILDLFGLSWWGTEKLVWLSVFIIGAYSSYCLANYILKSRVSSYTASFIYIANTYFLLLFGGRQLGVALAYSLSPLVLLKFIQFIDECIELRVMSYELRKKIIVNGLWLSLLVCFDLRLAYLVLGAVVIYAVVRMIHEYGQKTVNNKQGVLSAHCLLSILGTIAIPLLIATVVHLFWILPLIMVRGGFAIGEDLSNVGMLRFLSVADFSHALSLLAPNWPENLFGKVYFLQPEFLALPLFAFGALLLTGQKTENNKRDALSAYCLLSIRYFALFSLLGVFLAKGANPPFGGVYVWLFEHLPGFVMFRDPTKFYLFIAIGYSILIPYTLSQLTNLVIRVRSYELRVKILDNKILRNSLCVICYLLFVGFWLFTIRAVFVGQARSIFRPLELTHEYVELKDLLVSDKEPYRTLWIPSMDKFVYSSDTHPLLTSDTLWKNASNSALISIIEKPDFLRAVQNAGVRYIVIPQDLEKRIFLSDYKYDQTQRDSLVMAMERSGLRRLSEFQGLAVFENTSFIFTQEIPDYVHKQEYWSRIGLGLSLMSLILFLGLAFFGGKKISTQ